MPYVLLAMAFIGLMGASRGTYHALGQLMETGNQPLVSSVSSAGAFLLYRAAILDYVQAHPDATGSIPVSELGLTDTQIATLEGSGNSVIAGSGSTTVETWAPMSASDIEKTVAAAQGDLAIGTAEGATWTSPLAGNMGSLPVSVPQGNVVSVVVLTGSSF